MHIPYACSNSRQDLLYKYLQLECSYYASATIQENKNIVYDKNKDYLIRHVVKVLLVVKKQNKFL